MADRRSANSLLFAAALAVNLAFDALFLAGERLAPPHLLLRYAPEFVAQMVSPLGMSLSASPVLAAIAVLVANAVPPGTGQRFLRLAGWLAGFWALSEGLLALVWLSAPAGLVAGGLALGLPRSAAVAFVLVRLDGGR
ncbi:MAG TPA: hypothetical protein VMK42_12700 [Anaeromyxobacteraceae bacterium]|nr:hypothetical protein [Anaeromyxobacteraceae bacterium]